MPGFGCSTPFTGEEVTDEDLNHLSDIYICFSTTRTQEGQTALQLAISNQLPLVVDAICTRGADMSVVNDKGDPPLWLALENGLEDIASTLVRDTGLAVVTPSAPRQM